MVSTFLLVLYFPVSTAKEIKWPPHLPPPYGLFRLDEGTGMELNNQLCMQSGSSNVPGCGKDKFLESNKGIVYVQKDHQPGFDPDAGNCGANPCHPGANWLQDPHFGVVLSCGNGDTMHKDAIRLPDLDYGSTGKWAMNFW
jgi:hypothetical protein